MLRQVLLPRPALLAAKRISFISRESQMKSLNTVAGRNSNRKRLSSADRLARASAGALEALENRVLMSSTTLALWDFGGLSAAAANAANGTTGGTTATNSVTSPAETSPYTGGMAYTVGMANGSDTGYQYPAQGVSYTTDNTGYLIATGVADTGGNGGSEDGTAGYVWYIGGENKATGEWTDAAPIGTQGVQFNVPTTGQSSSADVSVQFDLDVSSIKAEAQFMVEYTTDVNDAHPTWTDVTQNLTFGPGNIVDPNDLNGTYVTSGGNVTATIGTSSTNSVQLIQNNSTTNPSTYTNLVQAGSHYIANTVNGTDEGYTLVSMNGDYAQIHGPLVGGNNTPWLNDLTVALPANAINQSNFAFRVVNAGTGTGETSLSGTTGTTIFKNWRFNDVRFLATVPIPQKPVIEAQPAATSAEVGSSATFTSSAQTFDTNTTVQWEVETPNGTGGYNAPTPISNDTAAGAAADSASSVTYNAANGYATDTLTVPVGTGQAKSGNLYEAIFTSNTASAPNTTTTNTAPLTVTTGPAIVLNPQSVSVPVNSASVIFDAYATGLSGLSVQWYVEAPGGTFQPISNSTTYAGVTTDVLTITNPTNTLSGNLYEAKFTDTDGSSTTTAATLSLSRSALVDWTFNSAITPLPSDQPYAGPQGFQPTIGSTSDNLTPLGMANDYNGSQSGDYEDVISSTTSSATDPTYTEYTWRLRGLAGNGQFNNGWSNQAPEYTQGAEIDVPASGYDHFTLAFDWFCTSDGMRDLQVQYYDPTTSQWTNDGSPYVATSNDFYGVTTNDNSATGTGTPTPVFVNLSGISDLQSLSTLKVRLVSAYDPSLPQIDDANTQDVNGSGAQLLTHGQYAQAQVDAANEQQELNFVIPYSGSYSNFTLDYNGLSTGPISYTLGGSASAIQTALDAIIPGGVTVTDNQTSPADANSNQTDNYTVIFNDPSNVAELPITIDPASGTSSGGIGAATAPGAVGLDIQASSNGVEQYNGATGNWRFDNIIVTADTTAGAPTITGQPSPATFTIGGTPTSVSFTATGSSSATVQWWVSTPNSLGEYAPYVPVTFTNSAVVTSGGTSTLTLTQPTVAQSGDLFEAVFTGTGGGTNTSNPAQLTVNSVPTLTSGELTLAVNTVTGDVELIGNASTPVTVGSYQIKAGTGDTLNSSAWNSLTSQRIKASSGGGGWTTYAQNSTSVAESTANSAAYNNVGTGTSAPIYDLGDLYTPGQPHNLQFISFNGQFAENDAAVQYYSSNLPAWVSPLSQASWNSTSNTLTVTGPTAIIEDPGTAEPIINASGSAAVININPASTAGTAIHLGGLSLTNGASAITNSLGAVRSLSDVNLLVIGTPSATTAPTFNIDSTSTLDLRDNDLAILNSSSTSAALSTVQEDLQTGSNYNSGTGVFQWNGPGLISSVAPTTGGATGLGYATQSELSALSEAQGGSAVTTFDGQSLGANAVLVKYTLMGDSSLEGTVDGTGYNAVLANYDSTADWTQGNFHYFGGTYTGGVYTPDAAGGQDYNIVLNNYDQSLASYLPGGVGGPAAVKAPPATVATAVVSTVASTAVVTPTAAVTPSNQKPTTTETTGSSSGTGTKTTTSKNGSKKGSTKTGTSTSGKTTTSTVKTTTLSTGSTNTGGKSSSTTTTADKGNKKH
jgi:hypothetical protein